MFALTRPRRRERRERAHIASTEAPAAAFASKSQDAISATREERETALRDALRNGEFYLVYQPIFDLCALTPTGMEALIRWRHPRRGAVRPEEFIPSLEATGLISEIGSWVLREACSQAARWRAAAFATEVAVNISARQLESDAVIADVHRALEHSGLDPCALTIEVSETALMRNAGDTSRRLRALKKLGVRVAIDDFGTGYCSLAHLQQFALDALKIDRSLIAGLAPTPQGEALIHTLVAFGMTLGVETVAEGIEHQSELACLRAARCERGQGFFFSQPLNLDAATAFLAGWAGISADQA
jgi:EAL domain-containing protein (putative c-di-GMP-specific phosphodiesterase class I)